MLVGRSGGGGGGSGGGGSGGGGGGGGLFGTPGEDPERLSEEERAEILKNIIETFVEPNAWDSEFAFIRYYQGNLIILAPDWIHRQISGYPYAPQNPRKIKNNRVVSERRYVKFTPTLSIIDSVDFQTIPVSGTVGGTTSP